ncbi:MAG TPA: hypothetical protein VGN32_10330, partial [Ktedonobacterales bacterium]|nr:hypothetical protein [Ktedonobacterales bacterium]
MDTPEDAYQERCARFAAERDRFEAQRERYGQRIFMFGAAVVGSLLLGLLGGVPLLLLAAPVCLVVLVVNAVRQGGLLRLRDHAATLYAINTEGPLRLRRDWTALPLREPSVAVDAVQNHPYAGDLDLLGHASLLHLLGTANTPGGQSTLQSWLLEPATPETIALRQAAVKELIPAVDVRDEMAAHARTISLLQPTYEPFLRWCESDGWLTRLPVLVWLSRILPVLTIAGIVAQVAGWLPFPIWLVFAAGNLLLSWVAGKQVEALLERVSSRQSAFQPYADVFAFLADQEFAALTLRSVQQTLAEGGGRAASRMRQLARIMRYADLRLSLFFPVLQFFLLWNFHVLWLLEGWKREA